MADLTAEIANRLASYPQQEGLLTQTTVSHRRGVTLLRPTGKWNAQINLSGKQVRCRPELERLPFSVFDRSADLRIQRSAVIDRVFAWPSKIICSDCSTMCPSLRSILAFTLPRKMLPERMTAQLYSR